MLYLLAVIDCNAERLILSYRLPQSFKTLDPRPESRLEELLQGCWMESTPSFSDNYTSFDFEHLQTAERLAEPRADVAELCNPVSFDLETVFVISPFSSATDLSVSSTSDYSEDDLCIAAKDQDQGDTTPRTCSPVRDTEERRAAGAMWPGSPPCCRLVKSEASLELARLPYHQLLSENFVSSPCVIGYGRQVITAAAAVEFLH